MILYGSKYGSVREYVGWIQAAGSGGGVPTDGPFRAYDLKREKRDAHNALSSAATDEPILVLAPIYAGQVYGAVRSFVEDHVEILRSHPLALGLTSLYHGEKAQEEVIASYPAALVAHASRQFLIGGRIRPAELPFLIRGIIRKITGTTDEIDSLDRDLAGEIARWLTAPGD
jgi:menaquinone-dependent protoporphyrinogen IX oxidase